MTTEFLVPNNTLLSNVWQVTGLYNTHHQALASVYDTDYIFGSGIGNAERIEVHLATPLGNLTTLIGAATMTIGVRARAYPSGSIATGDLILRFSGNTNNVALLSNQGFTSNWTEYLYTLSLAEKSTVNSTGYNQLVLLFRLDNFIGSGIQVSKMYFTLAPTDYVLRPVLNTLGSLSYTLRGI